MIRVEREPEPAEFHDAVRAKGAAALLELIGDPRAPKRPGPKRKKVADRIADIPSKALPAFWTDALPALRSAYGDRCAYLAMRIHPATGLATVDHLRPKTHAPWLAYEWANYRLAAHRVNTFKDDLPVLDPFEIQEGWFHLDLGNFRIEPSDLASALVRQEVDWTIRALRLNEETFRLCRQEYYDLYNGVGCDPLPLSWLQRECPFVARELARQCRLRPEDR